MMRCLKSGWLYFIQKSKDISWFLQFLFRLIHWICKYYFLYEAILCEKLSFKLQQKQNFTWHFFSSVSLKFFWRLQLQKKNIYFSIYYVVLKSISLVVDNICVRNNNALVIYTYTHIFGIIHFPPYFLQKETKVAKCTWFGTKLRITVILLYYI